MKAFLLAGLVAFLGVPLANATVEVRISNPGFGDTGWIQCSGTSCAFIGTVGNYSFTSNITTRLDPINPFLDMSYSATTSNPSPGTIVIEAMADGYTTNTPQFEVFANGNSSITTTSNTVAAYGGSNDTICAASGASGTALSGIPPTQVPLTPGTPGTCTPSSATGKTIFSASFPTPPTGYGSTTVPFGVGPGNGPPFVNPYSLGLSFTITNPTSAGTASGDIALDAVPEPASVALFGGVLLFTVSTIRRKMRRTS